MNTMIHLINVLISEEKNCQVWIGTTFIFTSNYLEIYQLKIQLDYNQNYQNCTIMRTEM